MIENNPSSKNQQAGSPQNLDAANTVSVVMTSSNLIVKESADGQKQKLTDEKGIRQCFEAVRMIGWGAEGAFCLNGLALLMPLIMACLYTIISGFDSALEESWSIVLLALPVQASISWFRGTKAKTSLLHLYQQEYEQKEQNRFFFWMSSILEKHRQKWSRLNKAGLWVLAASVLSLFLIFVPVREVRIYMPVIFMILFGSACMLLKFGAQQRWIQLMLESPDQVEKSIAWSKRTLIVGWLYWAVVMMISLGSMFYYRVLNLFFPVLLQSMLMAVPGFVVLWFLLMRHNPLYLKKEKNRESFQ